MNENTGNKETVPHGAEDGTILDVAGLDVVYHDGNKDVHAVRGVGFRVGAGRKVVIVGESGSGKTTVIESVLGILPATAAIGGTLDFLGHDLVHADEMQWQSIRRDALGYVPQDPETNLDPTMSIGRQLSELVGLDGSVPREKIRSTVLSLLDEVGVDDPELRYRQYPHELSGGLKQRVLIAGALVGNPKLLVADEPTSALDVTVQKTVLDLMDGLVRSRGVGLLMVTHDLAVAAERADHVVVMHNGEIVEQGGAKDILRHPKHPYTRHLIDAAPAFSAGHTADGAENDVEGPTSDVPVPAVEWNDVTKEFRTRGGQRTVFRALDHVSIAARRGTTLAIVGESGSGKTTLLRLALQLERPTSGQVLVNGRSLESTSASKLRSERRHFQLVQQNPFDSLDPLRTVGQSVREPLDAFGIGTRSERKRRVRELLEQVALPDRVFDAYPGQLSGGQCQRVAIARALAAEPDIVLLDEPVSALDVSVQAQILDLLGELQERLGLTYVLVSHDLAVVADIADDIAVMRRGKLMEYGVARQILGHPSSAYTRTLLEAVPGRSAETGGNFEIHAERNV